jgi:hypothetical protein
MSETVIVVPQIGRDSGNSNRVISGTMTRRDIAERLVFANIDHPRHLPWDTV